MSTSLFTLERPGLTAVSQSPPLALANPHQVDVPYIAGTTMKVVELVMAQKAHGWSPEELHFQHPYLSMSQIHSALAYYWEHKETLDTDMERQLAYVEQARQDAGPSPLVERLCEQGLLE